VDANRNKKMAGFDFKNEIRQSIKRKKGMLTEVAMKLDPNDPTKVLVGDEEKSYEYDPVSGIIDRGQSDRVESLVTELKDLRISLKKLAERAGGFTKEAKSVGSRRRRTRAGTGHKIKRYLQKLDGFVEEFKDAYDKEDYDEQESLRIKFKQDFPSPKSPRHGLRLRTKHFNNGGNINQIELDNFSENIRNTWVRILSEIRAGGMLNLKTQKQKYAYAFKVTPEVKKRVDVVTAKRVAAGRAQADKEIAKEKGATVAKGPVATEGQLITGEADEDEQRFIATIKSVKDSPLWEKYEDEIKKLSPNGRKQLVGAPAIENSHMNLIISFLEQKFKDKADGASRSLGGVDIVWSMKGKEVDSARRANLINKNSNKIYGKIFIKAYKAAVPIKGGEEEGAGGMLGKAWGALEKFGGVDPTGAYEDVYGPMEESKLLEFEKTLKGLKLEKLHNKLMPKQKKLIKEEYNWDDPTMSAAQGKQQLKRMHRDWKKDNRERAERGEESTTLVQYVAGLYGAYRAQNIIKRMSLWGIGKTGKGLGQLVAKTGVGKLGRGAVIGARAAAAAGGQAAAVGGATATGFIAAATVGAAAGTLAGYLINKAAYDSFDDETKERISKATKNFSYAKAEMQVYCHGKGSLCREEVECKGKPGGYVYETAEGLGIADGSREKFGWNPMNRKFRQTPDAYHVKDGAVVVGILSAIAGHDVKTGKIKMAGGKKAEVADDAKIKKYESCAKKILTKGSIMFNKIEQAGLGEQYKILQMTMGFEPLPKAKGGKITSKATVGAAGTTKVATEKSGQIKEIQKALIEFFGPELEAKLGDEYTQGVIGKKTKYAFFKFSSKHGKDPNFPTGKNQLRKMPKFIRKKLASIDLAAADDDTELEKMVVESKMNLQQKRLLEMNKRLMKL
jgi:hypothetical protein